MDTEKGISESFDHLPLKADLLESLKECGYTKPLQVQERALIPILYGRDVFVESPTGSGKTILAIISALQLIDPNAKDCQALILCPTRELAKMTKETATKIGQKLGLKTTEIYGGTPMAKQEEILREGVSLVFGTPGRTYDLLERESFKLKDLKLLIVQECDRMLDLGFQETIQSIVKFVPPNVQMCIFSSSCPVGVRKLNEFCLQNPVHINKDKLETERDE